MRVSAVLIAVFIGLTSARKRSLFGGSQAVLDEDLKIPGDSPLSLCPKSHDDDILAIDRVDLSPNPPKAGQDLIIKASGKLSEPVEEGAYVVLQVKYGLIRLVNTKADLCEQIKNVDLECPLSGDLNVIKTVQIPNEVPNGKYTVFADVYTKDDKPISCLTASVVFGGKSTNKNEIEL